MADDPTATDSGSLPMQDVQITTTSVPNDDNDDTQTGAGSNTIRSRGSKVSNLRAAFEQSGSNDLPRSRSNDRRLVSGGRSSGVEAELSRLKDVLAKEQEQRDASKQRMEAMQSELEELRKQLQAHEDAKVDSESELMLDGPSEANGHVEMEDVIDQHDLPDEMDHSDDHKTIELSAAKAHYESELGQMQAQLADMKRSIATNTRIETHELTDTSIVEDFRLINYHIQDWVVNTLRRTKIEKTVEEMLIAIDTVDEKYRGVLRALFSGYDSAWKVAFVQSAVCCYMVPVFQHTMPFGLPSTLRWSEALKSAFEELETVLDPTAYSRWRATTCDVICQSEVIAPCVLSASDELATTICSTIDKVCGTSIPEPQVDALRLVVRKMINLSHSLCTQRASYSVHLPAPGSIYIPDEMESSLDSHDLPTDCKIQCAEFPAVFKSAATGGEINILKARVSLHDAFD
ncbi:hypothetical protein AMS68_002712 [Peltaster fructicola]|uniref:Uncharacterized protein n=1 Tax=Peltaster fructicola TaxID=286661 RepID=A0A6H0XRD4_9PEZI|nr:hypothetical protein AMS68_002712 [Peltaster fructicola]